MYIRFVWPVRHAFARAHPGFFYASAHAAYPRDPGDWRIQEIEREMAWFGEHLAVPKVLRRRAGRHGVRAGICWFRDSAAEHVSRARYVAWLLDDIGVPIVEIRASRAGTEIWADANQIVAIPDRGACNSLH